MARDDLGENKKQRRWRFDGWKLLDEWKCLLQLVVVLDPPKFHENASWSSWKWLENEDGGGVFLTENGVLLGAFGVVKIGGEMHEWKG